MQKIKNLFLATICTLSIYGNAQTTWTTQTYSPDVTGIENNPMKGWLPGFTGVKSTFPYSMDHFYMSLNSVYKDMGQCDWTAFDNELNRITSKGGHAAMRFWIDYPDSPSGMPAFLLDDIGSKVPMYDSNSPDWNNETLMLALEDFIALFGARYDGDPRIVMVEAGLYGFWGEWHTSGQSTWPMTQQNKDRLIVAYNNAFKKTHVALRSANHPSTKALAMTVGYYDDSFAHQTLCTAGTWCYWYTLVQKDVVDNYKYHPMGGELRPEIQDEIFDAWPNASRTVTENMLMEDLQTCINTTHLSFMKSFYLYKNIPTPTEWTNAIKAHKMMGYQFYARSVMITPGNSSNFTLSLNLQNRGVAPIYYNWQVEFSAINSSGQWLGVIGSADWNITSILPNSTDFFKQFTGNLPGIDTYKILMRFKNPLDSFSTNARVLRFANEMQDIDKSGWLTLGTVSTIQAPLGGTNRTIPGLIEGEHYDEGGQGIAFNDNTTKQGVITERPNDNVDITSKVSASNSLTIGFSSSGEWLEYSVNSTAGNYNVILDYYCGSASRGQLKVSLDNTELATISNIVNSGWDTRVSSTVSNIYIPGGKNKILKLEYVNGAGFNIDDIQFISTTNPQNSKSIISGNDKTNSNLNNANRIYPNPVTKFLNIESDKGTITDLTIYSMSGQILYRKASVASSMQIDISSLNIKGMVMVKINTGTNATIHKVLIM